MARRIFQITQKHYTIITQQAIDNLPRESGGFLGGKDDFIQAILPNFNQHMEDQTGTFALTSEDITRAHAFFQKHGLKYFGAYHSHPSGVAYPSDADIRTGQRYHFIIGAKAGEAPILAAYEIIKNKPHQIPIQIVSNDQIQNVDLYSGAAANKSSTAINRSMADDAADLYEKLELIKDNAPKYRRLPPVKRYESDFSVEC